jgi:hypothetical protein
MEPRFRLFRPPPEIPCQIVVDRRRYPDPLLQVRKRLGQLTQGVLEAGELCRVHIVKMAALQGPELCDLHRQRHDLSFRLAESTDQSFAVFDLLLRRLIEDGAEPGETLYILVLGDFQTEIGGRIAHRTRLGIASHPRHRLADVDRRQLALSEEGRVKVDLSVGHRDEVGRDKACEVPSLGLDDGQGRDRAAAERLAELEGALHETGMHGEDVAGIGFPPWRTPKDEGEITVGLGVAG